ncbi:hypothetical protein ACLB2K_013664 [Fragaria x ananassa]
MLVCTSGWELVWLKQGRRFDPCGGQSRESLIIITWPCNGLGLTVNAPSIAAPTTLAAVAQILRLCSQSMDCGLTTMMEAGLPVVQRRLDEKEISTLLDPLEKYWPSLSCEKHGTCSAPVTGDEYNYFLTTLNVYFKYNVTAVLNDAGYVPSNTEKYPLGGIVSAIQNAFHATPKLVCRNGAVEELHLCFYKDFKPRDCAGASSSSNDMLYSSSSCPNYISIPAYASLGEGNVESEVSWVPEDVL